MMDYEFHGPEPEPLSCWWRLRLWLRSFRHWRRRRTVGWRFDGIAWPADTPITEAIVEIMQREGWQTGSIPPLIIEGGQIVTGYLDLPPVAALGEDTQ